MHISRLSAEHSEACEGQLSDFGFWLANSGYSADFGCQKYSASGLPRTWIRKSTKQA
jgi:hypothetical protein